MTQHAAGVELTHRQRAVIANCQVRPVAKPAGENELGSVGLPSVYVPA